ncbi:phosphotransferase family protein [Planctomonas psychrotolerans]|uniref:phosphotransferase family protein n=1 Tax=Planctomonas psychrotolerans TaxID=2528712 RepID=UPI00123A234F|nr:phosphotransferase [Planctomonas psychrotolerans]
MREAPPDLTLDDVADAVSRFWGRGVDTVEHLPLGFGAHHWDVVCGNRRFFATLDAIGSRHTERSLESAYSTAARLAASGLEFVAASDPSIHGGYTAPLGTGRLSIVPWIDGHVAGNGSIDDAALAEADAAALTRLHAARPPEGIPRWRPRVDPTFAAELRDRCGRGWEAGPHGEAARALVLDDLDAVERWTARYTALAARASGREWVVTHGEPHTRNQLLTGRGLVFVDWESVAFAPRERDLRVLVDSGYARLVAAEAEVLELFDLEWRLDEIREYTRWFSRRHGDGESDRVALDGLAEELHRPDWHPPATPPG